MNKYDKKYIESQLKINDQIKAIYYNMVDSFLDGASLDGIPENEVFLFKDYPLLKKKADKSINAVYVATLAYITNSIKDTWKLSNSKNDSFIDSIYSKYNKVAPKGLKTDNLNKLGELFTKERKGLKLSDRVWNSNANLRDELQSAINAALKDGKSAKMLARDIKVYLANPNTKFRVVKNKFGEVKPSLKGLSYAPGQGVYRSSMANAMRVARTEINRAYRESDYIRWQQNPFVNAYQIFTSGRVLTVCEYCKELAGVYPKDFKFMGWHPQCMCYAVPILISDNLIERIINGEKIDIKQPEMPNNYNEQSARSMIK